MLIPLGSDAPLYHRPIATIAMIVLCVIAFPVGLSAAREEWMLEVGNGVHPRQWVTNLFLHANIMHLIGNMVFLWVFGMIVEGKLGWFGFTLVYLGIGIVLSATIQLAFHPQQPIFMLGASGAVCGLLAICLIWAPANEINCIAFVRFTAADFDLSILWFVAFYICMDCLEFATRLFAISGAMAHLGGTVLGFGVGILLLKFKLVDCENWDLFAVMEGRKGESKKAAKRRQALMTHKLSENARLPGDAPNKKKKKKASAAGPRPVKSIEDKPAAALRAMRLHIEMGEIEAALGVYKSSHGQLKDWQMQESDWIDLIQALSEQDYWSEAARVMHDYMKTVSEPAPRVQLKLAQVLIQKLSRPTQGLSVLEAIPTEALPEKLEAVRTQLAEQAQHMREEGELELQDEMW